MYETRYYVYVLIDPRTNQQFYVGKGVGDRMYVHQRDAMRITNGTYRCNKPHHERIRNILQEGLSLVYERVMYDVTETMALNEERRLIDLYGRQHNGSGLLLNLSRGGQTGGETCKPICQYDMEGKLLNQFESAKYASEQVRANRSYITQVCKGLRVSAGGFIWAYKGTEPIVRQKQYWRPIHQKDKEGNVLATYKSLTEAEQHTGVPLRQISDCARARKTKPHYTAGGFGWDYVATPVTNK